MALDPMSLLGMFTGPGGNNQQPNAGLDGINAKLFGDLAEKIPIAGPIASGAARGLSRAHGLAANIASAPINGPLDALVGALGGAQKASRPDMAGMGAPNMGLSGLPPLPPASSRPAQDTRSFAGQGAASPAAYDAGSRAGAYGPPDPNAYKRADARGEMGPPDPRPAQESASAALRNQYQAQDPTADPLRKRRPMGPF